MGRLTKDQIDKMVADSEKYAEEDKKIKEKIDSKNSMEHYITQMKSTVTDKDKLGSKLDSEDTSAILEAIDETADWMNANDEAGKDEIDDKLKELQSVCDPIITKVYGSAGDDSGGGSWDDDDTDEDFNEDL
jgi:heat shock protein 5